MQPTKFAFTVGWETLWSKMTLCHVTRKGYPEHQTILFTCVRHSGHEMTCKAIQSNTIQISVGNCTHTITRPQI